MSFLKKLMESHFDSNFAAQLVVLCFNARTVAHLMHLQTKSYSAHKALNEFYDEIVNLVDKFVEAFQGQSEVIQKYPSFFKMYEDPIDMIKELQLWIEKHREHVTNDSSLQNILDEIIALCASTVYKLQNLK